MTTSKTINAEDLKMGDKFFHNELHSWEVIQTPYVKELTVVVMAKSTKTNKPKRFEFGRKVDLDLE